MKRHPRCEHTGPSGGHGARRHEGHPPSAPSSPPGLAVEDGLVGIVTERDVIRWVDAVMRE